MRTISTFKELQSFITEFLSEENNTIFTFYVLFFMFEDTVYQIDYNEEMKEYTVTPIDRLMYTNLLDEDEILDEEGQEAKEKGSVIIDDMEMYLAFNKIDEPKVFSSITEIDEMRTRYTATIEESVVEEYEDGTSMIFTNMIYGPTGLDDEDYGTYILSKYIPQQEKIESVEYKNLPSIETIEFQDKDGVDSLANILVEKGYGSTYSLLISLSKRDIFIQASQEVFSDVLVLDRNAEIEVPDEEESVNSASYMKILPADDKVVLGKKNDKKKKMKVGQVIDVIESVTNINDAILRQQEELARKAEENDKNIQTIPSSGIRAVYSYEGIQNLITSTNRIFHMICLGTAYCYEITRLTNNQYKVDPKGRDDSTLNEWFNKYANIILLFNGNIANSFARVTNPIIINELNDIDENIYTSYAQLKAYTIQFTIKGQICPVTILGSSIQELFKAVVNDSTVEMRYISMVDDEDGLIGWDGASLYYSHVNETARYTLDLDKVMRGLETLLDKEGLLGNLKRWTTKIEEAEELAREQAAKEAQKKADKNRNKKKSGSIKYTIESVIGDATK